MLRTFANLIDFSVENHAIAFMLNFLPLSLAKTGFLTTASPYSLKSARARTNTHKHTNSLILLSPHANKEHKKSKALTRAFLML